MQGGAGWSRAPNYELINSRYLLFSYITALITSGYGDEAAVSNDIYI